MLSKFFFSSRRRHTRQESVSWARRCVQETVSERHMVPYRNPDEPVQADYSEVPKVETTRDVGREREIKEKSERTLKKRAQSMIDSDFDYRKTENIMIAMKPLPPPPLFDLFAAAKNSRENTNTNNINNNNINNNNNHYGVPNSSNNIGGVMANQLRSHSPPPSEPTSPRFVRYSDVRLMMQVGEGKKDEGNVVKREPLWLGETVAMPSEQVPITNTFTAETIATGTSVDPKSTFKDLRHDNESFVGDEKDKLKRIPNIQGKKESTSLVISVLGRDQRSLLR
eukprot:TRINITY_DN3656_c0_g1_i2.p2 TRINITY_DN3656_c0_g1~~TRINITY_DN3656_c0_g1_i2.p2  ORF type:complete len:282 (+),score=50.67 TRINITY_DN3656_c0_g1_i2:50-895(+)